jgi:hypothetical protein
MGGCFLVVWQIEPRSIIGMPVPAWLTRFRFSATPFRSVRKGSTSSSASASVRRFASGLHESEVDRIKPGAVDWKVTIVDRTTKQTASIAGKGKVLPADFGIVHVGLFADAETRVPNSAIGVVGDSVFMHFSAVGFARDKDKKQPDLRVSMRILDEQGKPTMAKPIIGKIDSDVPADARWLPMQFGLTLNRPGRFTIELTAEDRLAGKTSHFSYGIRDLPLE